MNNFRVCSNYSEIVEVIRKLVEQKRKITLWQTINNQRVVFDCKIKEVDLVNGNIVLAPIQDQQEINFKNKISLYFFGEDESIVFKANASLINNKFVTLPFPKEVRLVEKRAIPRFIVPENSTHAVAHVITNIANGGSNINPLKVSGLQHSVKLLDISIRGCAFQINEEKKDFFTKGSEIYLTQIDKYIFEKMILGTIAYSKMGKVKRGILTVSAYRIGVKFEKEMDTKELYFIQSLIMGQ